MTDYKQLCAELLADYEQNRFRVELAAEARAALAKPEPVDGEVAELVTRLEEMSNEAVAANQFSDSEVLDRAVDLLERLSPPQPVPVSERLPGLGDCDAEGRCWLCGEQFAPGTPTWVLGFPAWAKRFPEVHRFWLPAHALPVPTSENV